MGVALYWLGYASSAMDFYESAYGIIVANEAGSIPISLGRLAHMCHVLMHTISSLLAELCIWLLWCGCSLETVS